MPYDVRVALNILSACVMKFHIRIFCCFNRSASIFLGGGTEDLPM